MFRYATWIAFNSARNSLIMFSVDQEIRMPCRQGRIFNFVFIDRNKDEVRMPALAVGSQCKSGNMRSTSVVPAYYWVRRDRFNRANILLCHIRRYKGKLNLLNFKTLLQTELKCETILN